MALYKQNNRYHRRVKQQLISDNELWKFSMDFYMEEGVEAACLYLQNNCKLNVNLILACIWCAHSGRGCLSKSELEELMTVLAPWQHKITELIRQCRYKVPRQSSQEKIKQLRKAILKTEILTEKVQQCILYEKLCEHNRIHRGAKKTKDGINNISNYFSLYKLSLDETVYTHVRHLLAIAFDDFLERDFPQMRMDLG